MKYFFGGGKGGMKGERQSFAWQKRKMEERGREV